jgi:hypothetical protein
LDVDVFVAIPVVCPCHDGAARAVGAGKERLNLPTKRIRDFHTIGSPELFAVAIKSLSSN